MGGLPDLAALALLPGAGAALPGGKGERPPGSLQHWVRAELAQALDMSPVVDVGPFRTRSGTPCALHALHPFCRNCAVAQLGLQRQGQPSDFNNTCWICHFHLIPTPILADAERSDQQRFKDMWNGQNVAFGQYWVLDARQ